MLLHHFEKMSVQFICIFVHILQRIFNRVKNTLKDMNTYWKFSYILSPILRFPELQGESQLPESVL